ncbi:hypothetical protein GCM10022408_32240 [Hymenobacter fastidiosus]|uniref:Outer membrane protein beta-barrel domain-containing protein n=1 Tax=Hymenobacter fastidiosus TaxID=486264 RepID=A0ABP7STK6_9BACT
MKKIVLAAALLGAAVSSQAQTYGGTHLGFKAGASIATLSGVINATPHTRTSFVMGPMLRLKPSAQGFTVQVEALLSSQGAKLEVAPSSPNGATTTETVHLAYVNVPLLLRQYIGGRFYVNVGPQLGLLVGNKRTYKSVEGALVGGVGAETAGGLVVDLRLNYGLSDINNDAAERAFRKQLGIGGLHNRGGQVSVGYLFGRK